MSRGIEERVAKLEKEIAFLKQTFCFIGPRVHFMTHEEGEEHGRKVAAEIKERMLRSKSETNISEE